MRSPAARVSADPPASLLLHVSLVVVHTPVLILLRENHVTTSDRGKLDVHDAAVQR
jgi:hypothetical protein